MKEVGNRGEAKGEYEVIKGAVERERNRKEAEGISKAVGRRNVGGEVGVVDQAMERRGQENMLSDIREEENRGEPEEFGVIPGQGLNDRRMNALVQNLVSLTLDESSKPKIITNRKPVEAYMGKLIA